MTPGNRTVLALFALAVAAALATVAWLVLGSAPRSEPVAPPPPVRLPDPAARRKDPPKGPSRVDVARDRPPPRKPVVLEVAGLVIGPDDLPVPGAEVAVFAGIARESLQAAAPEAAVEKVPPEVLRELFALDPEEVAATSLYSGVPALPSAPAPEKEAAPRAKTGEDGRFRIATKGRGPFRIDARKEGVGHAVATDVLAGGPDLVLKLGPAATLAGRVVSGSGAPVDGAVVVIRSGGTAKGAISGADGSFSVPDLAPGRYALQAGAQGYAPASLPSVEAPPPTPLEVVLGSGHVARISVTKREFPANEPGRPPQRGSAVLPGTPLEGALVVLMQRQSRTYRSAVTGPDGTVRIDRLGAGQWALAVRKEGFLLGLGKGIQFRTGSPPEESREVRMFPAVVTPVRVLDEAGAPVRGARVYTGGLDMEYDERHSVLVGRTDDEGRIQFGFDDSIPWKAVLWVVPEEGAAVLKVEPEDQISGEEVRAVARPGRGIQGTVTDQKGRGVKGAQVLLNVVDDDREIDVGLYVYTDEKGFYRFPQVPFGEVTLEVDAGGEWDTEDVEADVRDNPLVRDFKVEVEAEAEEK